MKINWNKYYELIPHKVKVGKKYYDVVWRDAFDDEKQLGETDFNKNLISINLDQTNKEAVHTYFHEFLHSASQEYDIGLTESQVQKLEKSLKDWLNLWKR